MCISYFGVKSDSLYQKRFNSFAFLTCAHLIYFKQFLEINYYSIFSLKQKLDKTQKQIIQTDYKVNQLESMCRREPFSQKLDIANQKLDNVRNQGDTEIKHIKSIEKTVEVVDEKLNKSLEHSKNLDTNLTKLESEKVQQIIDKTSEIKNQSELNQRLEMIKLDQTIEKLTKLNERLDLIEPELAKVESIEQVLERFEKKQDKLMTILIDAINRKKSTTSPKKESSPSTDVSQQSSVTESKSESVASTSEQAGKK